MDEDSLFEVDNPLFDLWESIPEVKSSIPIFVPSLGRATTATTPTMLPTSILVVEAHEYKQYVKQFGAARVLKLPGNYYGTVTYARNWIKKYSLSQGHRYHWQVDDNIKKIQRHEKIQGKSYYDDVDAMDVFGRIEQFVMATSGLAIVGIAHIAFAWASDQAFALNKQVYSCVLVENNDLKWRPGMPEDTDYSLQVLISGQCTALFTAYVINKARTESVKGGHTAYYQSDGRLRNIEGLQKAWPSLQIGKLERFGKPVAQVGHAWRQFRQRPQIPK